jgi:hypothetical protein
MNPYACMEQAHFGSALDLASGARRVPADRSCNTWSTIRKGYLALVAQVALPGFELPGIHERVVQTSQRRITVTPHAEDPLISLYRSRQAAGSMHARGRATYLYHVRSVLKIASRLASN